MNLRKKEILIFAVLFLAALIALLATQRKQAGVDHGRIRITVEGEEYGVYDLGKNQKIKINDTNTCRIKDGEAQMIEANCPDHLCIHQSPIDGRGGMIICLPNQVIVEGIPSQEAATDDLLPDAVAQ